MEVRVGNEDVSHLGNSRVKLTANHVCFFKDDAAVELKPYYRECKSVILGRYVTVQKLFPDEPTGEYRFLIVELDVYVLI